MTTAIIAYMAISLLMACHKLVGFYVKKHPGKLKKFGAVAITATFIAAAFFPILTLLSGAGIFDDD